MDWNAQHMFPNTVSSAAEGLDTIEQEGGKQIENEGLMGQTYPIWHGGIND
jgi:hypothetical protein